MFSNIIAAQKPGFFGKAGLLFMRKLLCGCLMDRECAVGWFKNRGCDRFANRPDPASPYPYFSQRRSGELFQLNRKESTPKDVNSAKPSGSAPASPDPCQRRRKKCGAKRTGPDGLVGTGAQQDGTKTGMDQEGVGSVAPAAQRVLPTTVPAPYLNHAPKPFSITQSTCTASNPIPASCS